MSGHQDGLFDAIALTECIRRDDEYTATDMQAILRNCNVMDVAVTLAKLLAEAADDIQVRPAWLRYWAEACADRP